MKLPVPLRRYLACPRCERLMPRAAERCPHCGVEVTEAMRERMRADRRTKARRHLPEVIGVIGAVVALVLLLVFA